MDYRIAHKNGKSYIVEERKTIVKGFWIWKKSVEVYQRSNDYSRPEYRHPLLFVPPLPPYRKLQDAIVAVYNQHKTGCSFVKKEVENSITYYYYEKNK